MSRYLATDISSVGTAWAEHYRHEQRYGGNCGRLGCARCRFHPAGPRPRYRPDPVEVRRRGLGLPRADYKVYDDGGCPVFRFEPIKCHHLSPTSTWPAGVSLGPINTVCGKINAPGGRDARRRARRLLAGLRLGQGATSLLSMLDPKSALSLTITATDKHQPRAARSRITLADTISHPDADFEPQWTPRRNYVLAPPGALGSGI